MENTKQIADLILHLVASEHFGKISLSNSELLHPTPVRLAANYALKRYKDLQTAIDPDANELDHWQSVFWYICNNYMK